MSYLVKPYKQCSSCECDCNHNCCVDPVDESYDYNTLRRQWSVLSKGLNFPRNQRMTGMFGVLFDPCESDCGCQCRCRNFCQKPSTDGFGTTRTCRCKTCKSACCQVCMGPTDASGRKRLMASDTICYTCPCRMGPRYRFEHGFRELGEEDDEAPGKVKRESRREKDRREKREKVERENHYSESDFGIEKINRTPKTSRTRFVLPDAFQDDIKASKRRFSPLKFFERKSETQLVSLPTSENSSRGGSSYKSIDNSGGVFEPPTSMKSTPLSTAPCSVYATCETYSCPCDSVATCEPCSPCLPCRNVGCTPVALFKTDGNELEDEGENYGKNEEVQTNRLRCMCMRRLSVLVFGLLLITAAYLLWSYFNRKWPFKPKCSTRYHLYTKIKPYKR